MSHVDDGCIEAWLDRDRSGMPRVEVEAITRHIQTCAACAARLQQATVARSRAESILGGSPVTGGPLPDFEQVVARAQGNSATNAQRSGVRPLVAILWAASVLAAIGLGWVTRDLLAPRPLAYEDTARPIARNVDDATTREVDLDALVLPRASAPVEELASSAGPGSTPPGSTIMAAPAEAVASGTASAPGVPPTVAAEPVESALPAPEAGPAVGQVAVAAPSTTLERTTPPAAAPPGGSTGPQMVVAHGQVASEGRPLAGVMISVEGGRATLTDADGRYAVVIPEARAGTSGEMRITASMLGYGQQALRVEGSSQDSVEVNFSLTPATLALSEIVAVGYGRQAAAPVTNAQQPRIMPVVAEGDAQPDLEGGSNGTSVMQLQQMMLGVAGTMPPAPIDRRESVSAAEASRRLGTLILTLPDLEILAIEWVESTAGTAVYLRQQLTDGESVLLLLSPGSVPITAPALPGQSVVNVHRGNLHISAQAEMSLEELGALLENLR